jgi:hypothetical protein
LNEFKTLKISRTNLLDKLYEKHFRKLHCILKEKDLNIIINSILSYFETITLLMNLAVKALEFEEQQGLGKCFLKWSLI